MLSLVLLLLYVSCALASSTGGLPHELLISSDDDAQALLAFLNDTVVSPSHPLRWNSSYGFCSWTGVSCSASSTSHVIAVSLPSMNLSGPLSPHLADLPFLSLLNLSDNQLSGHIPAALSRLQLLTHLDLSRNPLSGPIPVSFASLSNLRMLQLHHVDNLSGSIPVQLTKLANLTHFCLGHNNLTGTIPPEIGTMKNLIELGIYENPFTGRIPPELGQLKSLQTLKLFNNNLTAGELPPELGNMTSLQYLYLFNCGLSGSIPAELGRLVNLLVLALHQNHLSGPIPPTLGQLEKLTELNFYDNNVSGNIPPQLGQLSNLQKLFLSANNLSGSIPPEIGKLRNLQTLELYTNNLQGPLPAELGQLTSLQSLVASNNILQGNLPREIGQLNNLIHLHLSENNFSGGIPEEFGMLQSLQSLDISRAHLTGKIPSTLGNLRHLLYLLLTDNKLSGPLPPALANCSKLQVLSLGINSLSGEIPVSYATFAQLQTLSLYSNYLSGSLPVTFSNASALTELDLSYNNFSGPLPDAWSQMENVAILVLGYNHLEGFLPAWMWNMSELQWLDLSNNLFAGNISNNLSLLRGFKKSAGSEKDTVWGENDVYIASKGALRAYHRDQADQIVALDLSANQFQGEIPKNIGDLSGVFSLNLSRNRLTGAIPSSLGDIGALESLDLSYNNLSGKIPQNLLMLTFLAKFNVSYNNLSGPIPQNGRGQFATFENVSYIGNPHLCGFPLTLGCSQSSNQTGPPTEGSGHHQTVTRNVIKFAMAAAAAAFTVVILGAALLWCRFFKCCSERFREIAQKSPIHLFDERLRVVERELFHGIQECNDCNLIGVGGTSTVHKYVLTNGKVVALKKMRSSHDEVALKRHLLTEGKILGKIRHRNVLKMLGICATPGTLACILDFVDNGSLDDHLHEAKACPMSWEHRFKVAIGIAQGLSYLHNDTGFGQILHLDLKPGNILLDHDFEPRISDFGISRLIDGDRQWASVTSNFRGSIGYVAPECSYTQKVSDRADVYSFGVILLEMLTGKRPTSDTFGTQSDLRAWVAAYSFPENTWTTVLDKTLKVYIETPGKYQEVHELVQLGLQCTVQLPNNRPNMKEVMKMLMAIRQEKTASGDELHDHNIHLPSSSTSVNSISSMETASSSNFTSVSSPLNRIEPFSRDSKMDKQCIHSSPGACGSEA